MTTISTTLPDDALAIFREHEASPHTGFLYEAIAGALLAHREAADRHLTRLRNAGVPDTLLAQALDILKEDPRDGLTSRGYEPEAYAPGPLTRAVAVLAPDPPEELSIPFLDALRALAADRARGLLPAAAIGRDHALDALEARVLATLPASGPLPAFQLRQYMDASGKAVDRADLATVLARLTASGAVTASRAADRGPFTYALA